MLTEGPLYEMVFQSTLSVRRATVRHRRRRRTRPISIHALREESDGAEDGANWIDEISIHALREESDHAPAENRHHPRHFNPRSP